MIVRQGDVVLRQVARREISAEPKDHVLAVGEESGHWHALVGRLEVVEDRTLVTLDEPAMLRVEGQPGRHTPIKIPAGTWEVRVEREYVAPAVERQVSD